MVGRARRGAGRRPRAGPTAAWCSVVFEDRAARTALPYQMQEEFTQRAVLIGGASVSVQGLGPGFATGGAVGSLQTLPGQDPGLLVRGGASSWRWISRPAGARSRGCRAVDINAAGFWFGGERARDVTLSPTGLRWPASGSPAATSPPRWPGRSAARRAGSGSLLGDEEVWLSLKTAGARDRTLDQLREALVPNTAGAPVRVGDLARLDEREALARISREDQQYVRVLSYDFRGPAKLANRTHEAFMRSIAVPAGYTVSDEYFGWQDDQSQKGLWLVFAVGLALVVLSVAMVFDSAWGAAMVFLSLPIALAGVVVAFWVTGSAFTREAAVG